MEYGPGRLLFEVMLDYLILFSFQYASKASEEEHLRVLNCDNITNLTYLFFKTLGMSKSVFMNVKYLEIPMPFSQE